MTFLIRSISLYPDVLNSISFPLLVERKFLEVLEVVYLHNNINFT